MDSPELLAVRAAREAARLEWPKGWYEHRGFRYPTVRMQEIFLAYSKACKALSPADRARWEIEMRAEGAALGIGYKPIES
jgi:hypothetical protein